MKVTKYPNKIIESEIKLRKDKKTQGWNDLNNIKKGKVCKTDLISSKSGTFIRAKKLILKDFNFNIKKDQKIKNIKITLESKENHPNARMKIGAPSLSLIKDKKEHVLKGDPLLTNYKKTIKVLNELKFTIDDINSNEFSLIISFPENTSSNIGNIFLRNISITIETEVIKKTTTTTKYDMSMVLTSTSLKEPFEINFIINSDDTSFKNEIKVNIELDGLQIEKVLSTSDFNQENNLWTASISDIASLLLEVKVPSNTNKKIFNIKAYTTTLNNNIVFEKTIIIKEVEYEVSNNLPPLISVNDEKELIISLKKRNTKIDNIDKILIEFPEGLEKTLTSESVFEDSFWIPEYTYKEGYLEDTITYKIRPSKTFQGTSSIKNDDNEISTIKWRITDSNPPLYIDFNLDKIISHPLIFDDEYCISLDLDPNNSEESINDHPDDLRLSIIQDDDEIKSPQRLTHEDRLKLNFTYKQTDKFLLRVYLKNRENTLGEIKLRDFSLQNKLNTHPDMYTKPNQNFITDPEYLIDHDDEYSNLTLTGLGKSPSYIFYGFKNKADLNEFLVKGIKLEIETNNYSNILLKAKLISNNIQSPVKTGFIDNIDEGFNLGGLYDLWGLYGDDINLGDIKMELLFENLSNHEEILNIRNLNLNIDEFRDIYEGNYGFKINNEHSKYYETFLLSDENNPGINNELVMKNLNNSDGEFAAINNYKSKTINFKILITGDDQFDLRSKVDRIVQWLSPKRNALNVPITKKIVFDYDKTKYYKFILDGPLSINFISPNTITCDVKINIPKGVGYNINEKILGYTGYNRGILKINPLIEIRTNYDENIKDNNSLSEIVQIKDNISGQKFKINYKFMNNTLLIIDTEKRIIKDESGNEYTKYIDIDSDWFSIKEQFDYSGENCLIERVRFKEVTS